LRGSGRVYFNVPDQHSSGKPLAFVAQRLLGKSAPPLIGVQYVSGFGHMAKTGLGRVQPQSLI
tara:strand:+ start:3110 stop:3298 length:189 start_codon:yes stop_codon:yes gene_type:complete